ncbi:Plasma membrane fusion protein PRM1 [Fusarium oxysporum f. sp. albedinis]|nr:Plasma membrane fusion protein PRM1 [Fusarium oxysporum f. sp. albedinis]
MRRVADPRQEIGSVAAHEETIQAISCHGLHWLSFPEPEPSQAKGVTSYWLARENHALNKRASISGSFSPSMPQTQLHNLHKVTEMFDTITQFTSEAHSRPVVVQ